MKVPIQLALSFPQRLANNQPRLNLAEVQNLTFEKPDTDTFRCLALAREALKKGGNMPCILNAANEIAVINFLNNKCSFLQIAEIVEQCMERLPFIAQPSLQDLLQTDSETRIIAQNI
jgi:1-deoxy-D-xylulose-5-phosphate reductoisomerase